MGRGTLLVAVVAVACSDRAAVTPIDGGNGEDAGTASLCDTEISTIAQARGLPVLAHDYSGAQTHIAYVMGEDVVHGVLDESTGWWVESVARADELTYGHVDLEVGIDGAAHLVFSDRNGIQYVRIASEGIAESRVTLRMSRTPAIAVDADGLVQVVFTFDVGGRSALGHAWTAPELGWMEETIPESSDVGSAPAISGTRSGARIVWLDAEKEVLLLAEGSPERGWAVEAVAPARGSFEGPTLVSDSLSRLHLVWSDGTPQAGRMLRYGVRSHDGWSFESIDDGGGYGFSLTLGAENTPLVSYVRDGELRWAQHNGDHGWTIDTVDEADEGTALVSKGKDALIAYTRGNELGWAVVGFCESVTADRFCADDCALDTTWSVQTVDPEGAWTPSAAIDADGIFHVAYQDPSRESLKYARGTSGGEWAIETVDTREFNYCALSATPSLGTGWSPAVAVSSEGVVHVSYLEASPDCGMIGGVGEWIVRHATRTDDTWSISLVDEHGGKLDTSIVVDSEGAAHIFYVGPYATPVSVRHAIRGGETYEVEAIVTSTGPNLISPVAAIDAEDHLHLIFAPLSYATRDDSGWLVEEIGYAINLPPGFGVLSLALDSSGAPHIAANALDGLVEIHRSGDGEWIISPVPGAGGPNDRDVRVAITDDGTHHLAFHGGQFFRHHLVHGTLGDAGKWTLVPTPAPWHGAQGIALLLGASGVPYMLDGLEELKLITPSVAP